MPDTYGQQLKDSVCGTRLDSGLWWDQQVEDETEPVAKAAVAEDETEPVAKAAVAVAAPRIKRMPDVRHEAGPVHQMVAIEMRTRPENEHETPEGHECSCRFTIVQLAGVVLLCLVTVRVLFPWIG